MVGLCRVLSSSGKQSPLLSDLHVGRWHSRGCCCHPCASAPISNRHQTCWCCARAAGAVSWFSACVISATRLGAFYGAAPALHQVMGGCPRPRRVFAVHLGAVLPTGSLTSSDEVSGGCKTCNCFFFTTNTPANSLFSMAYGKICLFRTFSGFCSCWTSNVSPSQLSACWKTVIILYHLVRDVLWWCS